jgi:transposase
MRYKAGIDKQQLRLMPTCLDDYVPENHLCRVISAFTEQLDMVKLGYAYAECKETGCRPYDPRMMLNLYVYGYMNRVRSSRRLQAETVRNVEVMWLMDGLTPDDKTISNFRKDNAGALRKTFRTFVRMFRELGLYGGEVEAVDGTKFRASNSRRNNHNQITVARELSRIDKQISAYLNALEQSDAEAEGQSLPTADQIKAALKKLSERKVKFEELLERVQAENEVSTVDPDARLMRSGGDARPLDVCHNVQTVVDSKHHLIVDFEVINRSDDKGNLQSLSESAMEALETDAVTVLADKGYYDGEDIVACEENGVTCLVAKPKQGVAGMTEGFTRGDFHYDLKNDCYICPCQNQLRFMRLQNHSDGKTYRVYANYPACSQCLRQPECTRSKYRQILRLPYQDTLDIVDERTRNNKALYRKRSEIVEHPFGTIKAIWGYKQFLCRGKQGVSAETALAYLAYNLRRVVNIFKENGESMTMAMG